MDPKQPVRITTPTTKQSEGEGTKRSKNSDREMCLTTPESCRTAEAGRPNNAVASTNYIPSSATKKSIVTASVGASKLVRKHLLTFDRNRHTKAGVTRIEVSSPSSSPRNSEHVGNSSQRKGLPQSSSNNFCSPSASPTQIRRNVTEEEEHHASSPANGSTFSSSSSAATPGSLEEEAVRIPLQHVQARENCINPVSRILWSKLDEDSVMDESFDSTSSVASSPISDFRVVSPIATSATTNNDATMLARPMPVRMLLA